ncbi:uncharacterized protein [Amphiura filiformis]|uniref:uncharacterized protein isoform X2 n=1 Tax=Amphiura filiformis TaxID=82378 RepID=UPI003B21E377
MAEGQFLFWVWNQEGNKGNQSEDAKDKLSKEDEETTLKGDGSIAENQPQTDNNGNVYMNGDVEHGIDDSEEMKEKADGLITELPPEDTEEPPAYMIDDEFEKDDGNVEPVNDYNSATMSTVKDHTMLKFEGDLQSPPDTPSVSEMAIYNNCDNYLVRRDTKTESKDKKKSNRKCVCISLLCFLILLLSAAILLFLLLYFWGVIGEPHKTVIKTTGEPDGEEGHHLTVETPPIDLILVNVSIILQREFLPVYFPPSSVQATELAAEITEAMNTIFEGSPRLKEVYDKTDVSRFSNNTGKTLNADLMVYFDDSPVITIISEDDESNVLTKEEILDLIRSILEEIITDLFLEADTIGSLDAIDYLKGSAEVYEPLIILSSPTTSFTSTASYTTQNNPTTQTWSTGSRSTPQRTTLPQDVQGGCDYCDCPPVTTTPPISPSQCPQITCPSGCQTTVVDGGCDKCQCPPVTTTPIPVTTTLTPCPYMITCSQGCHIVEVQGGCDYCDCPPVTTPPTTTSSQCRQITCPPGCDIYVEDHLCPDTCTCPPVTTTPPTTPSQCPQITCPSGCQTVVIDGGCDTCQCPPVTTTPIPGCNGFECGNGQCIPASLECDKTVDCTDTSDELNCTHDCTEICPSGYCIQPNDNCDGFPQCSLDTESMDEGEQANCSYGCEEWLGTTAVPCDLPYNETYYPNFISKDAQGFGNVIQAELKLRRLYAFRSCDRRAILFSAVQSSLDARLDLLVLSLYVRDFARKWL